ncbi:non-ribosomal peptide synthetase [Dokdonella sp.]|uniref:non-ribosomal peptide synthetase n=1 Tax=Dokdonella sp. TaxID=2291710 RepID=UPI001B0FD862|nr:non-ribosomal peptide synthetase [Dokdonella sp.]MBO9661971.1 non-ribosomal peptide synthetase [Dokdonella sp.]
MSRTAAHAADVLLAPLLAQAAARPQAEAVRAGALTLDYAGLLAQTSALAAALHRGGVASGDLVALSAERSAETIAALLATLACGAAYLPLDLDFPDARLAAMCEDARPRCALGDAALRARLPRGTTWIDRRAALAAPADAVAPVHGELAYVLFTSGSTGRPKGVAMRRAAVAHLIDWHRAHARLGRPARTLQFAPLGFDVSFQEIFSTLAGGGTLVLPSDAERRDPYALLDLLAREQVERLFLPYVGLQALAEAVATGAPAPQRLRDVITAGEQLRITPAIRALFAALPGAVLHNHYGPTETHVVTAHELSGDPAAWPELPPIGAPLPWVDVRVVDGEEWGDAVAEASLTPPSASADGPPLSRFAGEGQSRQPSAANVFEGELWLGGDCLAAGYIHQPELTAERFVEQGDARWYRSGDRVRRHADGVLDYLGRLDEQIKFDGFRIEPAEIEAVLVRHAAVAEAVVVAAGEDGARRLVAHVVPRDPSSTETQLATALRAHSAKTLAAYLVPQEFVLHAALPLTASGKIDRRELARQASASVLHWRAGAPLREQLVELWQQLLGVGDLDAEENLFERGARSLLVVRALTELRRHGHVLSAAQMYEHPSAAAQAALLGADAPVEAVVEADVQQRGERQRASFARFGPRGGAR